MSIHDKYQILPCAFPHIEYLKDHKIQPLKCKGVKYTKTKQPMQKGKICPPDDSIDIIKRIQSKNIMNQTKFKTRQNQRRNRKRSVGRANKALKKEAAKAEVDGLNSVQQLFADTMDHCNTSSANAVSEQTNTNTKSIALRTKRKPKSTTLPEKQQIQPNPRRSNRVSMSK